MEFEELNHNQQVAVVATSFQVLTEVCVKVVNPKPKKIRRLFTRSFNLVSNGKLSEKEKTECLPIVMRQMGSIMNRLN